MTLPTDVEVSRALNALATTIDDQRVGSFAAERFQQIVDGALSGERKLVVHAGGTEAEPEAGRIVTADDGRLVAEVTLSEGRWNVERKITAQGSSWAVPRPQGGGDAHGR
jgi:hypothetical protein